MINQRIRSATSIQYLLISCPRSDVHSNQPPEQLTNSVIPFIKHCPEDLFQYASALSYFEYSIREDITVGHDFGVIHDDSLPVFTPHLTNSRRIKLFFIDTTINNFQSVYSMLHSGNELRHWFHFHKGKQNLNLGLPGEVISPSMFRKQLFENQSKIFELLGIADLSIFPSMDLQYKSFNEMVNFSPAHTNYLTIDSIIGNFIYEDDDNLLNPGDQRFSEKDILDYSEATRKAHEERDSWNRQNSLLPKIDRIDDFRRILYVDKVLKKATAFEPRLSSIIIAIPFHNPDSFPEKYRKVKSLILLEQSSNYIYESPPVPDEHTEHAAEFIGSLLNIRKEMTDYLDNVAFLHAGFQKSPVVRLPVKGASIYRELSFFGLPNFPSIRKPNSRRKLGRTLLKIGKKIKDNLISPEMEKLIIEREGQIVAISDLPIEWITIAGVPLLFTHDVCRLPQTSLPGLMAFYAHNNFMKFTVDSQILRRTLVIFGSQEDHFEKWQAEVRTMSKELGFSTASCTTVEMVNEAIGRENPELLIFDCHGGYDRETNSTFLWIGHERLTGDYIVTHKLAAPLIIISACGTAPTYGTFNIIANAFFEVGAICVTSTYLPISVDSGSLLYIRVLNKLSYALQKVMHRNWLEFICHLIRTSTITEAYLSGLLGNKGDKASTTDMANLLAETLDFYRRRDLYHELDSRLKNTLKSERGLYSAVVPEYLFYSNLGRGDLVEFQNWRERFASLNAYKL